jgi:hypothetical protein
MPSGPLAPGPPRLIETTVTFAWWEATATLRSTGGAGQAVGQRASATVDADNRQPRRGKEVGSMEHDQPGFDSGPGLDADAREAHERRRLADEREHLLDDREKMLDQRERLLDSHEVRVGARDAYRAERQDRDQGILADARQRDNQAEARDVAADERDRSTSQHSFLHDHEYDAALKARRSSALDRMDSQTDRTSAATDRSRLTEDDSPPNAPEG